MTKLTNNAKRIRNSAERIKRATELMEAGQLDDRFWVREKARFLRREACLLIKMLVKFWWRLRR